MNLKAETDVSEFIAVLDRLVPKPERMELIERVFRKAWTDNNSTQPSWIRRRVAYLAGLTRILTWERHDDALQSDEGSWWLSVVDELGPPFFVLLCGDISTPFKGDGTYRIRSGAPYRSG